ncbi:MAG: peptide chain release factor-like protein [Victivallaceae bacterium]|nr:peptide chain release factor-like protein [Victivallaceae bacterium]
MNNRDQILTMDDATLSMHCTLEFFKGSGKGGQKRNKTSCAARVTLTGTAYRAEDCSERSQHRNRSAALRKLKIAVAFGERETPAVPPLRNVCAMDSFDYPLWLAHLLDVLSEAAFDYHAAAPVLGVSPSALHKLLARDPDLWQFYRRNRQAED